MDVYLILMQYIKYGKKTNKQQISWIYTNEQCQKKFKNYNILFDIAYLYVHI